MNEKLNFSANLTRSLLQYQPKLIAHADKKAGVLVPIVLQPEPVVILTVRAAHLKSHPGQVSFPGGMAESFDVDITDTALRETHEEVGIPKHVFNVVGELSTALSKDAIPVYPVIGLTQTMPSFIASPDETAEVFTVPWQFFKDQAPVFEAIERHGMRLELPHYDYQGKHIWGLTAMILLELLNVVENTHWPLPHVQQG